MMDAATSAKLRAPFPPEQIDRLPKQLRRGDEDKGKCENTPAGRKYSADGIYCGGYHARSMHLEYVGHAQTTNRLLDVDPEWSWEPVAFDERGLPAFDSMGGLWIKLTIAGVTRFGYGDAQGKTGPNAIKEAIGDAIRNAAMRFGVALDLWSKSDLHAEVATDEAREFLVDAQAAETAAEARAVWQRARTAGVPVSVLDQIAAIGTDLASREAMGA